MVIRKYRISIFSESARTAKRKVFMDCLHHEYLFQGVLANLPMSASVAAR